MRKSLAQAGNTTSAPAGTPSRRDETATARIRNAIALVCLALTGLWAHAQTSTRYVQVVNPADPGLVWSTPQPIPAGTALGPAQLSATASTAGRFVYNPPAGTVVAAGEYTLSVTFTPTNPNYFAASATVQLTVTPAATPPGFQFTLASALPAAPIAVTAALPATVALTVQPLVNTGQTVTFQCSGLAHVACAFSPVSARLSTVAVPVTVTLTYKPPTKIAGAGALPYVRAHPGGRTAAAMAVWIFLMFLTPRSRRAVVRVRRLAMGAVLAATIVSGCGWSHGAVLGSPETLTITAATAQESHSVEVAVATQEP